MTSIETEPALPNPELKLVRGLMSPQAYPHPTENIRLIETHISWVLLTGKYAYKIKKPVNYGFLDFSTLAQRCHCCHEELRLNRRLATDWYLEVVPVTGVYEQPRIGGDGAAIEYAVKMRQFPTAMTLKDQAKTGHFGQNEIDRITDLLADFHTRIARTSGDSPYGDSADIRHWFEENYTHLRHRLQRNGQIDQLRTIENWALTEWQNRAGLMDTRKQAGFVRECHGDMHLGNMTQVDGEIVLFDCIEFNPMLRWIDVVSEIAFLMIDLLHFKLNPLAFRFLNRYLHHTGDYEGMGLLRYYLVYRALVLAKVSLLRAEQQHEPTLREQNRAEYAVYADLAECFTRTHEPRLLITHGFSGSGKSFYAGLLAEKLGAIQMRSDIERKRLHGFRAIQDTDSPPNGGIYTESATQLTYKRLLTEAKTVLESGFTAIVDATFLKAAQRELFQQLAADCGIPFKILDFQAADHMLNERIRLREQQNDASEATIEILRRQQKTAEALSPEERAYTITVDSTDERAVEILLSVLSEQK